MSTIVNQPTDVETNIQLVEQFVDAFWNHADAGAAEKFLSPAYVDHAYQPANQEGLIQTLEQLSASFPGHVHIIEAHVAQDDLVVLRMRLRATHRGAFRGTAPTGNPIDVSVYRTYRVAEGKIVEHWGLLDTATLLRQIGATPTPQNACAR